jgi:hypothetical protein
VTDREPAAAPADEPRTTVADPPPRV